MYHNLLLYWKKWKLKNTTNNVKKLNNSLSYQERQKQKVSYKSDADRIREINLLSPNESKFMRLLLNNFHENKVIVKNHRFFIVDMDNMPIAIFEYKDGKLQTKIQDSEDGLLLFFYKGILSSKQIQADKTLINSR